MNLKTMLINIALWYCLVLTLHVKILDLLVYAIQRSYTGQKKMMNGIIPINLNVLRRSLNSLRRYPTLKVTLINLDCSKSSLSLVYEVGLRKIQTCCDLRKHLYRWLGNKESPYWFQVLYYIRFYLITNRKKGGSYFALPTINLKQALYSIWWPNN